MRFSVYSLWTDPYFYLAAAGLGLSLFLLIYSIRRYLELANRSALEDETAPEEEKPSAAGAAAPQGGLFDAPAAEAAAVPPAGDGYAGQDPALDPGGYAPPSPAENFVMGIYETLKSLDSRMGKVEKKLGSGGLGAEFTVKFLDDMLSDFDSLDKAKIKARLEYLVSDLKNK